MCTLAAPRWSLTSAFARAKEFVAAGFASIVAGVVDMAVLVVLVECRMPMLVAAFGATLCGAVVNFALSKYVAFRDRSSLRFGQTVRFAGVALGTALLMALAMQLFAVALQMQYVVAKLPASVLVFVAWTYPTQRYFVFNRR